MKTKILFIAMCMMPVVSNAAIPYRVEQVKMPVGDSETYASEHRFYIGGAYNFSMWQNFTDENNISISGDNSSGYDANIGLRITDIFRLEASYIHSDAKWNQFSFSSDSAMLNMIIDARINSIYQMFHTQMILPYVGIGAGASWNSADDGVHLDTKMSPTLSALAGISVEFNPIFALDFGYRYFYVFDPETDIVTDFNPSAHQFRAGVRIGF
ncbi:MAG: porin family protein [Alphaproteobacteria bacterium]|nr:porin family protein [Alphaproteobacteria bacterium]